MMRRDDDSGTAAERTVMLEGLPAWCSNHAHMGELRGYMERWGTVTHSIIATDQRTLILHMAKRRHLVEAVKVAQAQLFLTRRKKTPSSAQPPRRGSTAAAKPKARAGSPPVVSVGVPRPVSGGEGSPSSGTARDVLGLATTMGAKTVDLATTVGGAAAAATANMMSQADSLKEAAKARVQEALLNSAVEKVDRARAALKSFDEEAQRLMREERPCAGVAFVSYETCLGHGASHAQLPIAHLSLLLYRYETCEMADDAIEAINDLHGPHIVQDLIEGRGPNDSRMSDRRSSASPDHDDSPEAPRSQRASSRDSPAPLSSKTGEDVQRHSRRGSGEQAAAQWNHDHRRLHLWHRMDLPFGSPEKSMSPFSLKRSAEEGTFPSTKKFGQNTRAGRDVPIDDLRAKHAPEPSDVLWENLHVKRPERWWREVISTTITMCIAMIEPATEHACLPSHRSPLQRPTAPQVHRDDRDVDHLDDLVAHRRLERRLELRDADDDQRLLRFRGLPLFDAALSGARAADHRRQRDPLRDDVAAGGEPRAPPLADVNGAPHDVQDDLLPGVQQRRIGSRPKPHTSHPYPPTQVFNTVFTAFLFLAVVKDRTCEEQASRTGVNMTDGNMTNVDPTSDCGTMQTFKRQWYELGGQLIVNNMFGDFIAMHLLLDFAGFPIDIVPMLLRAKLPFCCGSKRLAKWNINEWFAKRILPKLAHTQMAMDRLYIIRRDLYLAFRMQFAGKFVVICLMFPSAIPFLYLVGTAYFWLALWVDRYNLLRHVAPPPRTGPSLTVAMATFWFPLSIVLHLGLAIVFFIQHEGPQGSRVFSNHTAVETADRWAPPHARIASRPARAPPLSSVLFTPEIDTSHGWSIGGSTMTSLCTRPQRPAAASPLSTSI